MQGGSDYSAWTKLSTVPTQPVTYEMISNHARAKEEVRKLLITAIFFAIGQAPGPEHQPPKFASTSAAWESGRLAECSQKKLASQAGPEPTTLRLTGAEEPISKNFNPGDG
jgi:hypothetical protein